MPLFSAIGMAVGATAATAAATGASVLSGVVGTVASLGSGIAELNTVPGDPRIKAEGPEALSDTYRAAMSGSQGGGINVAGAQKNLPIGGSPLAPAKQSLMQAKSLLQKRQPRTPSAVTTAASMPQQRPVSGLLSPPQGNSFGLTG